MFDESMIQNLPVASRQKLVDYVEGLPSNLNKQVKMVISQPHMDPSFFNTTTRKLHKYSTIGRFLGKKNVEEEKFPTRSDYQREYCACMDWIYAKENQFDKKVQYKLETILNAECYNIETLIKVEVFIGDFITELENDREMMATPDILYNIGRGLNRIIMQYKLHAYDFYTYLDMNQDIQLKEADYRHLSKINGMINQMILNGPTMSSFSDIGILIYIYYKYLGIEKHMQKYNLFGRFKYTMKHCNCSDEDIQMTQERIQECESSKMSATAASNILVGVEKLSKMDKDRLEDMTPMSGTADIDENNGFIFTFKNIKDYEPSKMDDLSLHLRMLNENEILEYTDIDPNNLTFELSANDVGHIRNKNGFNIGTVYSSFNEEMKYIVEYEDEFYLLFKNRMNTRTVYGISIKKYPSTETVDRPRKLMTIKESTAFSYEFISEL